MKKYYTTAILVLTIYIFSFSQEIIKPNFALASHPMGVENILLEKNATVVELSIKNKSKTGFFCADKNISLIDILRSKEYFLRKSVGIPICPQTYRFNYVGELLKFKLFFPVLSDTVKYIDIIENCSENCFSIRGIILDTAINKNIDIAYDYYGKGELDAALQAFKMAVNKNINYPYGWLHYNIMQIYAELNDFISAGEWYKNIKNSDFRDKNELIAKLQTQKYYKNIMENDKP